MTDAFRKVYLRNRPMGHESASNKERGKGPMLHLHAGEKKKVACSLQPAACRWPKGAIKEGGPRVVAAAKPKSDPGSK